MAPRAYTLGRRSEAATATRQRIVERTIDLYRDRGVAGTTLKAVAEKADVSRGTILHHFGSADGLLGAVLDFVVDALELPDDRLLEGIDGRDARIRTLVEAMIAFQERSVPWWSMFEGQMQRPELQEREAGYWAGLGRLQAAALGPDLMDDPLANAVLLSLIHPATVGTFVWAFERAGLIGTGAHPVLGDMAVDAVRRIADRGSEREGL
jgi:AcrR family transcriptional regulator